MLESFRFFLIWEGVHQSQLTIGTRNALWRGGVWGGTVVGTWVIILPYGRRFKRMRHWWYVMNDPRGLAGGP